VGERNMDGDWEEDGKQQTVDGKLGAENGDSGLGTGGRVKRRFYI